MNVLDPHRTLTLAECYSSGASIRLAAKTAGCAKKTVERYYKVFRNGNPITLYAAQAPASKAAAPTQECSSEASAAIRPNGKCSLETAPQSPWQPIETALKGREHCLLVWDEECFPYPILAYWDDGYRDVKKKRVLADKPRWRCVEDELEQYADCQGGLVPDWWLPWEPPPKFIEPLSRETENA